MRKEIIRYLIDDACKNYFNEIEPGKVKILVTNNYRWKGRRRICGIWKWKPITIHFDSEYLRNSDIGSINGKVFHELMHVRLHLAKKRQPRNAREELEIDKEAEKAFGQLRRKNSDLIHKLEKPK